MILDLFLSIHPFSSVFANKIIQALAFEGVMFLIIPILGVIVECIIVRGLRKMIANLISGPAEYYFSNYVLFFGVVVHELSHALFALITGAKITKIALFKPDNGSLGHVEFQTRGDAFSRALQLSVSACAPVVVGSVLLTALIFKVFPVLSTAIQWVLTIYASVSVLFHMNMSKADLNCYFKGAGPILLVGLPVCLMIFLIR